MSADQLRPNHTPEIYPDQLQLAQMIEYAPIGLLLIEIAGFSVIHASQPANDIFQKDKNSIVGQSLLSLLPELGEQTRQELISQALSSALPLTFSELLLSSDNRNSDYPIYIEIRFQPVTSDGHPPRFAVVSVSDQTEQVKTRKSNEYASVRARSFLERAPVGTGLYLGSELKIELANATLLGYWGKGSAVIGRTLEEVMPELIGQPFIKNLRAVIATGRPYLEKAARAEVFYEGKIRVRYFDISYTPVFDHSGSIYGVLDMALDVTDSVLALDKLRESEQFARTVFHHSPVAKLVYTGENMVLREANEKMLKIFGRDSSIIGKPLFEAIPELKDDERMKRYLHVLHTGEICHLAAEKIELIKNDKPYTGYYDYTYKALLDTEGRIYGVMCTAIEVTEKVLALQELKEQEAFSRGAVELAELGTWSIDADTLSLKYSDRMIKLFGLDPKEGEYHNVIPVLQPQDRERVASAVARGLDPSSVGIFDEIYTVIQPDSNRKLIIHGLGRAIRNDAGKVIRMIGTAKDITAQRETQLALENQVQIRTEELASIVKEMSLLNEAMAKTNSELVRSNEELGQYAHVASHDLQEPLRKIMIYASIISDEPGLSEKAQDIINKISRSSGRMKELITDLLAFSRLLQEDSLLETVDLNSVLAAVLEDFELTMTEKDATIDIGNLPAIEAVRLQMNQLFYNLLSNALKFIRTGIRPHITVACTAIPSSRISEYISHPLARTTYHHIVISDNGVGFKPQLSDKIFEVFQRLHNREQFPGSGIGLSVCRRIISNHQGHIFAESVEGEGTKFHLILPDRQPKM